MNFIIDMSSSRGHVSIICRGCLDMSVRTATAALGSYNYLKYVTRSQKIDCNKRNSHVTKSKDLKHHES